MGREEIIEFLHKIILIVLIISLLIGGFATFIAGVSKVFVSTGSVFNFDIISGVVLILSGVMLSKYLRSIQEEGISHHDDHHDVIHHQPIIHEIPTPTEVTLTRFFKNMDVKKIKKAIKQLLK
ncbi:hypothetical protein GOV05_02960 [Candidatus Woesearchaeota archaeon]|nr:hypothetical protein [Candidatus Woesearchaeota archaeon]